MSDYTLTMLWPLAPDADHDQAITTARDDIAQLIHQRDLRLVEGTYTILEPGQIVGSTRWHVAFHGHAVATANPEPLPLTYDRAAPAPDFLAELAKVRDGFCLTYTREDGLKCVPALIADDWFDAAPMADDEPLAEVHHLPVGRTA